MQNNGRQQDFWQQWLGLSRRWWECWQEQKLTQNEWWQKGIYYFQKKLIGRNFLLELKTYFGGVDPQWDQQWQRVVDCWQASLGESWQENWQKIIVKDEIKLWLLGAELLVLRENGDLISEIKIEINPRLSQSQKQRLFSPYQWDNRCWWQVGICSLNKFAPIHNWQASLEISDKKISRRWQYQVLNELKLTRGVASDSFKIDLPKPMLWAGFENGQELLILENQESVGLPADNSLRGRLKLAKDLMSHQAEFEDDFKKFKNWSRKPQLLYNNFTPALALVLSRELEYYYQQCLIKNDLQPTSDNEEWWFYTSESGSENKLLWRLLISPKLFLKKINPSQKFLVYDDLKQWQQNRIYHDFLSVQKSSELTNLQKEVFLDLLAWRKELNEDWLWTDD